ncbi:MAG: hypothetical protein CO119_04540 [Flavobacteriales bacterium CG_4_9_14_3_um_filter_40_17]|nr:MAG: hypothetical protein CO119_04540 [Flavobacteriales bacterium CG_4_9_14_3_um_filter_40_17]
MIPNRTNLLGLFISSLLAISFLGIDIAKLTHSIYHHSAKICTQTGPVHFHEKPLDCKFCGIHFSLIVDFKSNSFESYTIIFNLDTVSSYHSFLKFNLAHSYSLRGPPTIA